MSVVTATILSENAKIDAIHELISIDIRREVNRIPSANLILLDGDAAKRKFALSDAAYFEPGKEIEIKLRYESETQDATVFKGPVIRHGVEATANGSLLKIELKDAVVKLAQVRKSAVFREQSDDEAISKLVKDGGLKSGTIAATKPKHAEIVQWQCSDWDFIVSRADSNGLVVVADDGKISVRKVELSGQPKHAFDYGISEIYDLEFEADASSQYASVESSGWDIKKAEATAPAAAKNFALSQGDLDGAELAETIGFDACTLSHPVPVAPEELQAWANARLMRSRMSMLRGRISTIGFSAIQLLDVMEIDGIGKRFNGKTLVTGICHRVDADGWRTDIQFGLSPRGFCQEDGIRDAPAAGLLPGVGGLQIGVVDKFKADPDKQMRVKVILPGVGAKAEAVWARLAAPDAGKDRGYFFRPETGDEVVVGFFNEDPRQPVILGALYSSKNSPPKDCAEITEDNLKKGIVTKAGTKIMFNDDKKASLSLETDSKNKIVLDDDKETIEISDKHGNKITLNKDGIKIDSAKDLKLTASGNVEIKGTKVDVK
ncbi:MAG: type VI secretion system tip protein VgrG [Aestuariivirga sp.]